MLKKLFFLKRFTQIPKYIDLADDTIGGKILSARLNCGCFASV